MLLDEGLPPHDTRCSVRLGARALFFFFFFLPRQRLVSVRVLRGWMPEGGDIQVGLEHFDPLAQSQVEANQDEGRNRTSP